MEKKVGDVITEDAIEIVGYIVVEPSSIQIELKKGINEITFYYEIKSDLTYTVQYLENGTGRQLYGAKTVGGKKYNEIVTEQALDLTAAGYELIGDTTKTIQITTGENIITFYYNATETTPTTPTTPT